MRSDRTTHANRRTNRHTAGGPRRRDGGLAVEPLENRTLFAILTVTTTQDLVAQDGLLSLREALDRANPGDFINFSNAISTGSPKTITLQEANGPLVIDRSLTVSGPGANRLTIDGDHDPLDPLAAGGGGISVNGVPGLGSVIHVEDGTVTISGVTVTGGAAEFLGGGILNESHLTLRDSVVTGNAATYGGGIGSYSSLGNTSLAVINSTVSNNYAFDGGGGITSAAGGDDGRTATTTITNSTVTGNEAGLTGGGIFNYTPGGGDATATLTVTNSTVSNNVSHGVGGGITNHADSEGTTANLNVVNSTVSGNTVEEPEFPTPTGTPELEHQGDGGGIANLAYDGGHANTTVTGSTLSGNETPYLGGGLKNAANYEGSVAKVTITNSTLSGNTAEFGGGIESVAETGYIAPTGSPPPAAGGTADVTITASTIAFNTGGDGGGIAFAGDDDSSTSSMLLRGTIVARNAGQEIIMGGDVTVDPASSFNLIGDGTGGLSADPAQANLLGTLDKGINPLLGALGNNGGPTQTHALLQGSPAINRGADFGLTTDQRGQPRPRSITADIGAYERAAGGAISGSVFNDVNGNGTQNGGEGPLAGVTVGLDQDNDGVVELNEPQWTTGPDGSFIFRGLNAGTQRLRFVPQAGQTVTQPASGVRVINLAANQNLGNQNFGVQVSPAPTPTAAPVAPPAASGYGLGDGDDDDDDDEREDGWPFAAS